MELYERELRDAQARIEATGRSKDDFSFDMSFQPPDPDGGGMFTVRYDVKITNSKTSKSLTTTGGIGLRWVEEFDAALRSGEFD
jgi:hypothetical protein